MFIDTSGTKPRTIYIKEDTEKIKNIELRQKVTKYLDNQAKKYGDASEALVRNITKAIKGDVDFGTLYPNGSKPSYLSQILNIPRIAFSYMIPLCNCSVLSRLPFSFGSALSAYDFTHIQNLMLTKQNRLLLF